MSEAPLNDNAISPTSTENINQEIIINIDIDYVEIELQRSISYIFIILSAIYFPLMGLKSKYNFFVFGSCFFFNILNFIISIKKIVISKNKEKNKFIIKIVHTCGCKKILEYNTEDIFFGVEENSGYPFFHIVKNYLNKKDIDFENIMKKPPIRLIDSFGPLSMYTSTNSVKFILNALNDNNPITFDVMFDANNYFVNSPNYYSFFVNSQPSNNDTTIFLYLTNFIIHFVISILICYFSLLVNIIVGCSLLIIFIGIYFGISRSFYRVDFFFSEEKDILIIGYVKMNQKSYDMIYFYLLNDFEKFAVVNDKRNTIKMVSTNGLLIEVINVKTENTYVLEEFVEKLNKCLPKKQV